MIQCPECGKEVSDQAASCPNCGCPIKIAKKKINLSKIKNLKDNSSEIKNNRNSKKIIIGIVAIVVIVAAIKPVGNIIAKMTDKTAPVLLYSGDTIIVTQYETMDNDVLASMRKNITATDNVTKTENIDITFDTLYAPDMSTPGDYYYVYHATDEAGNEGTIKVPVIVEAQVVESTESKNTYSTNDIGVFETIMAGISLLKENMKDPSSLKVYGASYDKKDKTVYYYYSATNSFGASISSYASYTKGDRSVYAPNNSSDSTWEVNFLERRYKENEDISDEYNDYLVEKYLN